MFLKSLSLVNFKNYEQVDLQFGEKINCFVGENGVGKTNILDAVHYLSLCKSNFNPVDSQNILHGQEFAVIQGLFHVEQKEENIFCSIRHQKNKQFKRNGKEYSRLSEHIGFLPLVMISPNDGILVNGGSEERRRFMNGVIAQYDRIYLENLIQYNRALSQRNKLLKDFTANRNFAPDLLEVWDDQLIRYGKPIFEERHHLIEKMLPVFGEYYRRVSGGKEEVELIYNSQMNRVSFEEGLVQSREKDRVLQYTSFGVHKDELDMKLKDHPLKKIGSQGQQKTFLVALKLAEFEFMRKLLKFPPILLLDDIFDKFDALRVSHIIQLVAENNFGQIFITDTNQERLYNILREIPADHRVFAIRAGGAIRELEK